MKLLDSCDLHKKLSITPEEEEEEEEEKGEVFAGKKERKEGDFFSH